MIKSPWVWIHEKLTTGIHGVGASTVESASGAQGKVDDHAALTTAHGAVSTATASRIAIRDAAARLAVADGAAAGDAATKGQLDTHAGLTTGVHGVGASTVCSEATADSKITTHKGDASAHHTKTGDNEVYGLVAAGIAADKPVAGIAGRWYFSTDTLILSRDNGNAWIEMARGETAIRLAQLSEKSHISLTDITANQHHNQSHDHSLAADGSPIAVAGVPNLDTSKITSGRFGMPRMPDGASGLVLTAQGAGVDPAYAGRTKIQDADGDTSWDVEQTANEDKIHGKVKGVEAFLLDDAGVLTLAKQSRVRAYRDTSVQSIASGVWTQISFNSKDFDTQSEFDSTTTYRFTAKTAGIYLGTLAAVIKEAADGALLGLSVRKNGAINGVADTYVTPGAAGDAGVSMPFAVQLAANDYLQFYVYQNSGVAKDLAYDAVGRLTWFFVTKIG